MELEISKLRTQLDRHTSSSSSHIEQVSALEEKVQRAERAAGAAQRELADAKKNLDRASEKAVKEGSERTSAETKIRTLERERQEAKQAAEESMKRVETLERKLSTLTTLHKESDARFQARSREKDRFEKEASELRSRLASVENDNLRLREERERRKAAEASGTDHDAIDELEDEERNRLEAKVRALEAEVFELRRGIWRERRKELDGGEDEDGDHTGVASPGSRFDDVDLSGGPSLPFPARRQSLAAVSKGFSGVLSSGFHAITGGTGPVSGSGAGAGAGARKGSLELLDDEGDDGFDEDAFRLAQEEEARKRVERVREIKRALKDWQGWRMDLVDCRVGGGGAGEIFDV